MNCIVLKSGSRPDRLPQLDNWGRIKMSFRREEMSQSLAHYELATHGLVGGGGRVSGTIGMS
jgi:hypothetical protein